MSPMVMAMMAILAQNASKWSILTILATIAILNGNMCMTMTNIHFSSAKNLAQQWRDDINRIFQSKVIKIFVILAVLSHFSARFRR